MPFVVVYDACVLYPASLRDLLVRLASRRIVHAKWTETILDEVFANLLQNHPRLQAPSLERTRSLMKRAVPEAMVSDFEDLILGLDLPDPDDRHVLAAAIRSGAQAIVTWNRRDFPTKVLDRYEVEALDPDAFVLATIDLYPGAVSGIVTEQADDLRNPPITESELLDRLEHVGLVRSVVRLREIR